MGRRSAPRIFAAALLAALAALGTATLDPSAHGLSVREARAAGGGYSLPRILELADGNHPNIAMARSRVTQARAQLDEAHWAPFSQFKLTGGVTVVPTLSGNNVYSPNTDISLTSSLGVGWRTSLEGVLPLWTFGKISNLWEAAGANVKVNEAGVERERDAVRVDVRKAFFGLQLARDSKLLLKDVRSAIEKGQAALQKQIDNDEGDPIDLLKLQTYGSELDIREAEASRYVTVALAGLRFYTGVPDLDILDEPIRPPKHQIGHITRYLQAAGLYRPEMAMVKAGITARQAQVQLARAGLFPDIGLGLQVGLTAAPQIADQINPYVVDPGNYFHYGAAVVFQWKLDLLPQTAKIRFAESQLDEIRAQQRFALGGVAAEVEQAYAEVIDWKKRVDIYAKAVQTAKRWLVMVQSGIDVGTIADKELLDPAKAYALNRFNQLNAIMELDMAMSRLAKATGWDSIAPDGS